MAYYTEKVGTYSELIAKSALIAGGWDAVGEPETREYFDISARHPETGDFRTFQVKTMKRREDKGGDWFVLFAKNGQGKAYTADKASDFYIGVLVDNGENPRVFLIENNRPEQTEYWSKTYAASEKWTELPISLDRTTLEPELFAAETEEESA